MTTRTIADKLQIKPNTTIWISDAKLLALLEPLADGVRVAEELAQASIAIMFADSAAAVRRLLDTHTAQLSKLQILWVAYPKGNRADINRDSLWPIVAEYGMRPNSQVAIDDTWSALRFRANKPGEAPFSGGGG